MTITVKRNGLVQFTSDRYTQTAYGDGAVFDFIDNTPPPPPAGRLTQAIVTWLTHDRFSASADLTKYKNVAGVIEQGQVPLDWPYANGSTYKFSCPANKYVAFEIVPTATQAVKSIKIPTYSDGVPLDISLSTNIGDFNPATALKVVINANTFDEPILYFRNYPPNTGFYTYLVTGQRYFLNVRPHDNTRTGIIGLAS